MKVDSSLIDSAYRQKVEVLKSMGKKTTPLESRSVEKNNGLIKDTVDLSSGFSLERIQSLLQTEIGKKVDAMFREAGIDVEAAAGLDWSPEATSGRIFDMTTGLFGVWRDQHKEMSEEELIDSFEKVIRTSVDKGADEAMSIIGAAGFGEQTQEVTQKTMSLLHEKYDEYFSGLREAAQSTSD